MITDWTKGLDERDAADIDRRVKSNRILLERLHELCEKKLRASEISSMADYESPSWAYRAADKEGFNRALRYIQLLTKEERNT